MTDVVGVDTVVLVAPPPGEAEHDVLGALVVLKLPEPIVGNTGGVLMHLSNRLLGCASTKAIANPSVVPYDTVV